MSKLKKIMILGASPSQIPIIKKAVDLGVYVITVDYLPGNIGHTFSHEFVNCSTVDRECVYLAAVQREINGIVTFASDVATPSVGFVAEQCRLPGGNEKIATIMSNKILFRTFQKEAQIDHPAHVTGQSWLDVSDQLSTLKPPLLFKPSDTSGSRGITRTDTTTNDLCRPAFEYARQFSRVGSVCVEEYIEGDDISGDGLLLNGVLHAVVTHKLKQNFMPVGHAVPATISQADQERVMCEVEKHCKALGYTDGPLDFDVRVSKDRIVALEMSPRLGGNGIPAIIERGTGFDITSATLRLAMGEKIDVPDLTVKHPCGSWIFGSEYSGKLTNIATLDEMKAAEPIVFEYRVNSSIGEVVSKFVHSGNGLGYALFDCPDGAKYCDIINRLKFALKLKVDSVEKV
jgi:biotin carboxylase